jgi:hypothetical protein
MHCATINHSVAQLLLLLLLPADDLTAALPMTAHFT